MKPAYRLTDQDGNQQLFASMTAAAHEVMRHDGYAYKIVPDPDVGGWVLLHFRESDPFGEAQARARAAYRTNFRSSASSEDDARREIARNVLYSHAFMDPAGYEFEVVNKVRYFHYWDKASAYPVEEFWPVWTFEHAREQLELLMNESDGDGARSVSVSYVCAQTGAPITIGMEIAEDDDGSCYDVIEADILCPWDLHFEYAPIGAEIVELETTTLDV